MDIWYNGYFMDFFDRQLGLNVKCTYAFDVIAKEFNTVWEVIRKRKDIYNATAYRKLPRFIHKVDTFEIIFDQKFVDEINT
ncbi:hypothetical protein D3C81_1354590 [compost metagenome]